MSWLISNKIIFSLVVVVFLFSTSLQAQSIPADTVYVTDTVYVRVLVEDTIPKGYDKRIKEYTSRWHKLIPSYSKYQFAGSMGLISLGMGWDYGKNHQWETDIFLGFVPKYSTKNNKITFTLKQNFIPWTVPLNRHFDLKPFSTGLYLNTVVGDDFWGSEPDKYPNGYYSFSTRLRFNVFVGQGLEYKFNIKKKKICRSLTFFYELSTNELYIISAASNKYLKPSDYIGLSLGIKMQFL